MSETLTIAPEYQNRVDSNPAPQPVVAILIPCYNEELTIGEVVRQFREQLPQADIYVFDNNSRDRTVEEALKAGATVHHERRQGKGYVVQSMFQKVEADVYVMVDGDGTYPAREVKALIEPVLKGEVDQVIGSRLLEGSRSEFRLLNRLGNHFFLIVLNSIFGVRITDLLSGYRAFSRRLVKGIPLFGGGFETEAEMTIKSLHRGFTITEIPVRLTSRPEGSHSKIRVAHDGLLILSTILSLFRDYKPLTFFGAIGLVFMALALVPGTLVIVEFLKTGLVPRLPSAVLATGLMLVGLLFIATGLILHTVTRRFQELDAQLRNYTEDLRRRL
ncbi:MAG TPA: glycosyltransferase [Blastocatellia bacterium]|nr:glycosyltransferase [Blastocatellia bacterium]